MIQRGLREIENLDVSVYAGPVFGKTLDRLIRESGLTQKEVARRAGMPATKLNKLVKGRIKEPTLADVARIAAVIGADLDTLVVQLVAEPTSRLVAMRDALPAMPARLRSLAPHVVIPREQFIEGDYDYPRPWHGGAVPLAGGVDAGHGSDFDVTDETATVLNTTVRDVQSGRFGVVRVKGHSMEPRLHDGDLVLVDTFDKEIRPKRIMAVYRHGDGSSLGYMHRLADLTIMTKANPEFAPLIVPDDAIIQGVVKKRLEEEFE